MERSDWPTTTNCCVAKQFFLFLICSTMKVSVPKDFGNTRKKPILPLVPEPIKTIKKEELDTVSLCSDPADHNSTQVKFSFKGFDGDNGTPHEILGWHRNMERALTGLDLTAGTAQCTMTKQFMRGSALSCFESVAMVLLTGHKADAIVHAEHAVVNHPAHGVVGHDGGVFANLQAAVTVATHGELVDLKH